MVLTKHASKGHRFILHCCHQALAAWTWIVLFALCTTPVAGADQAAIRPNILWITSEDNGPELGCYGDEFAHTPHLDRLAQQGMIYENAWSNAPVCAPARTTIITGIYPTSSGSQHMRSMVSMPAGFRMFPQFLREAGYYCTNNYKEDYNLKKPGRVWDDSSRDAHWKNREKGRPFFAVFNINTTHESQVRKRPHTLVHDPSRVPLPDYHPDTPEVRHDWAQYYDKISEMDNEVGKRLRELEEAGLSEDTIIFYFGDHGSGMPRSKRWLYQSGLRVPLIIYVPETFRSLAPPGYKPGESYSRLVAFVDLAPTMLSLANVESPDYFEGRAFMGSEPQGEQKYLFAFRDRMDERSDLSRAVRDHDYLYIRNYHLSKPQGQFLSYMFETPTTKVWKNLFDKGGLSPEQSAFWQRKKPEELYDLSNDPHQVRNLAKHLKYRAVLNRMRRALRKHVLETRDLGFMPEAEMHARLAGRSAYEVAHDEREYPLKKIVDAAELAATDSNDRVTLASFADMLSQEDPCIRYWAAVGLITRGKDACLQSADALRPALTDPSASVRIVAATALALHGAEDDVQHSLEVLLSLADVSQHSTHVARGALEAIDNLGQRASGIREHIQTLPRSTNQSQNRYGEYVGGLIDSILSGQNVPP